VIERTLPPAALLLAMALLPIGLGAQPARPERQIENAFDRVVGIVESRRAELERDETNCAAYAVVDEYLVGQFDLRRASRMILDDHWPDDPEDQQRFVAVFRDYLVQKYGDLVKYFNADTLRVIWRDEPPPADVPYTWIDVEMTMNDGKVWPVRLRMHPSDEQWGIYDVKADSYSYAKNFHDDFRIEIYEVGLTGLLDRLMETAAIRRQCRP
jgi:ABC-type transporter MlaC component